jgi:hypothetical protein
VLTREQVEKLHKDLLRLCLTDGAAAAVLLTAATQGIVASKGAFTREEWLERCAEIWDLAVEQAELAK